MTEEEKKTSKVLRDEIDSSIFDQILEDIKTEGPPSARIERGGKT